MEEIYLRDRGGIQPDVEDIMSDELITLLDGINNTLGTDKDPRIGEFHQFLSSISEASILKIEPEQMSSGKYADLDLTGGEDEDGYDPRLDEPKLSSFFKESDNKSIAERMNAVVFMTMFDELNNGVIYDKEYSMFFNENMMLPDYIEK